MVVCRRRRINNPYDAGNEGFFKLVLYQRRSVLVSRDILKKRDNFNAKGLQVQGKKREREKERKREREQERKQTNKRRNKNVCKNDAIQLFETNNRKSIQVQ